MSLLKACCRHDWPPHPYYGGSSTSASRRYTEAMKFRIVLEYDAEAKAFSAVCPELPGCASAGDTEEEARRNIREAIELYLEPSDIASKRR